MKHLRLPLVLILASLLFLYGIYIPRQAIHPAPNPIIRTPASVGLSYQHFRVSPADAELSLAGWWMPAQEARAIMVFLHGGGSNRHSEFFRSLDFYRSMVERGVSIAAIDLRNHGDSGADGRGLQFGRTEQADALAAIRWARAQQADLPLVAMGISMGGATAIHATAGGAPVDGLILLDPVLDTDSTFRNGAWVETGLPPAFFAPASWAARTFYGLPGAETEAARVATSLNVPILLLQDPGDPVTVVQHARDLASHSTGVTLWEAPATQPDHPAIAWKGRWGTHVAAFALYPEAVLEVIEGFIDGLSPGSK